MSCEDKWEDARDWKRSLVFHSTVKDRVTCEHFLIPQHLPLTLEHSQWNISFQTTLKGIKIKRKNHLSRSNWGHHLPDNGCVWDRGGGTRWDTRCHIYSLMSNPGSWGHAHCPAAPHTKHQRLGKKQLKKESLYHNSDLTWNLLKAPFGFALGHNCCAHVPSRANHAKLSARDKLN